MKTDSDRMSPSLVVSIAAMCTARVYDTHNIILYYYEAYKVGMILIKRRRRGRRCGTTAELGKVCTRIKRRHDGHAFEGG